MNTFIIWLVLQNKNQLKTHLFMLILALTDSTTATTFLALHCLKSCTAALFFLVLLSRVSFVLLTVISWERYSAVRHPLRYRLTYSRFRWMSSWLLFPLLTFGSLYLSGVGEHLEVARWDDQMGMCVLVTLQKVPEAKVLGAISLIFPITPLGLMAYCYTYIFRLYRQKMKRPVHRELLKRAAKLSLNLHNIHKNKKIDEGTLENQSRSLLSSDRALRLSVPCELKDSRMRNSKNSDDSDILPNRLSPDAPSSDSIPPRKNSWLICLWKKIEVKQIIDAIEQKTQFRVAASLLAVIVFNLLTWLPYCINYTRLTLGLVDRVQPLDAAVMYSVLFCSVCFNTLIYAATCRDIKMQVAKTARSCKILAVVYFKQLFRLNATVC